MSYIIREYTNHDVESITSCLVELQEFEQLMDPKRLKNLRIAEEYLQHLLELCKQGKGKIFVVEVNHEVIGMISIYIDHHLRGLKYKEKGAVISDLMILPEYRERGIAKELLERVEEYAKSQQVDYLQSHLFIKHLDGIDLFERNGYHRHEISLRKDLS